MDLSPYKFNHHGGKKSWVHVVRAMNIDLSELNFFVTIMDSLSGGNKFLSQDDMWNKNL